MIDKKARDKMVEAIRSYMDEKITAFQFDDALTEAIDETEDKTAKNIRHDLWFYYDDLNDHKIVASKVEWDYFNRLLLLLESEGEIEVVKNQWRWHFHQLIAVICFFVWSQIGFAEQFYIYTVPFGLVSIVLAWSNSRQKNRVNASIAPFQSLSNLLSVRRRVLGFARTKYPILITGRTIRSPFMGNFMRIIWLLSWMIFSPVVLFLQMFPDKQHETKIKMPIGPVTHTFRCNH